MDETVHFLITDKETFDRMNGREKKSERISKSETLDTMICDIQVLERLKSAKPALGSRKIDMKPILEDCKLSTWGSFKPPGTWLPEPDPISPLLWTTDRTIRGPDRLGNRVKERERE